MGNQQLEDHLPRRFGAGRRPLHFHAFGRLANAACGQHALAFDCHHAGAAISVGAIPGLRRVAKVRDVGAEALCHLPDGFAIKRFNLFAVEDEFYRFGFAVARAHRFSPFALTSFPMAWSVHPENILARTTADSAPPGPGRIWTRPASPSKVLREASHPMDPWPSTWLLFRSPPDRA